MNKINKMEKSVITVFIFFIIHYKYIFSVIFKDPPVNIEITENRRSFGGRSFYCIFSLFIVVDIVAGIVVGIMSFVCVVSTSKIP